MIVGLLHSHSGLAYIVLLAALLNLFFTLAANLDKNSVAILTWTHRVILWGGCVNILLGCMYWAVAGMMKHPLSQQWWIFISVLLWVPIDVTVKRFVVLKLDLLQSGVSKINKVTKGFIVQLVCISCFFGIMSMSH